MALLKQSTAYVRTFLMVQSADHISGLTGATVTVKIGKAGGTGAAAGGAVAEIDSTNLPGWYKVSLNTTDTNTVGDLTYHCTATSADPTDFTDQVVVVDVGTSIESQVWDALRSNHQTTGTMGQTLQLVDDGTAQAGASGTITLRAGASATDNFYKGDLVFLYAGTGANQPPNTIASYVGSTKVATMQNTWTVTPDNTSKYLLIPQPFVVDPWDEARSSHTTSGSFGEGVASVQGNVTGATGSVTAAVTISAGTGTGQVDLSSGQVKVQQGTAAGQLDTTTGQVKVQSGTGSGQISLTSGQVTVGTNNDKTGYALTVSERASVADKLLGRTVAGGADGGRTVTNALRSSVNKVAIAAGTMTVYQEDDSTPAFTAAVVTSAGNPISSIDPA